MADYVAAIDVALTDDISSTAASATDALGNLATSAEVVEDRVTRASRSFAAVNKTLDDAALYSAKAASANNAYQSGLSALTDELDRGGISADQFSDKQDRLGLILENALASARRQADAMRDNFAAMNDAADSTDELTDAQSRAADIASTLASRMDAASLATSNATKYQNSLNAALGVTDPSATSYASRQKDLDAYGASMDALRAKYSPLYASSKAYEGALDDINDAQSKGAISASEAAAATARVNDAFSQGKNVAAAATGTLKDATSAHGGFSLATAGSTRELIVMGHEVITGNWSRLPGSLVVMAERSGGLHDALGMVGTVFTSVGGLAAVAGVVAVGALGAMAYAAEENQSALLVMGVQLSLTHDNYAALAAQVTSTAKIVASTTSATTASAMAAGQEIASSKYYSGNAADMDVLLRKAVDLAAALGGDLPKAAAIVKSFLDDSGAAAKKAADEGYTGFNQALVTQIVNLQHAGQGGQAFQLAMDALGKTVDGASKNSLTPMQAALHDLNEAFFGTSTGGTSFAATIGGPVLTALTAAVNMLTRLIEGLKAIPSAVSSVAASGVQLDNNNVPIPGTGTAPAAGAAIPAGSSVATSLAAYGTIRDAIATQVGVDVTAFRVLQQGEGVMNPDGTWKTNGVPGSTIQGPLQVSQGTFNDMQKKYGFPGTIDDPTANTTAGAYRFRDVANMAQGNFGAAVLGYHDGPGVLQPGGPQPSAAGKAEAVAAMGQYSGSALPTGIGGAYNQGLANSNSITGEISGTIPVVTEKMQSDLKGYNDQLQRLQDEGKGDSVEAAGLTAKIQETTGALSKQLDARQLYLRSQQDALAANDGVYAGEKSINAELERQAQIERDSGGAFTQAQSAQALSDALAKQSQAYNEVSTKMADTEQNTVELAKAWGSGGQAVIDATAKQQAYTEALALFPANSAQFGQAFVALTQQYKDQAQSVAILATAQTNASSRDNLAYIETETATIGLNADQRTKLLAVMKAEQDMHKKFGDVLPQEAQDYIDLAGRTADASAAYQHQQQVVSDLTGSFSSMADTISNDVTQAFVSGQSGAVTFKNILSAVETQIGSLIAKLLLMNPLLNMLDGGKRTTISDVSGLLGSLLGNSGGTTTATDAGTAAIDASTIGSSTAAGVTSLEGLGLVNPISGLTPEQLATADNNTSASSVTGSSGGISSLLSASPGNVLSIGTSLLKAVNFIQNGGVSSALSSAGSSVSSFLGIGGDATAGAVSGAGDAAAGTASAAVSGASGAASAVGGTLSTITAAAPYLADAYAVYQIATQFSSGNTKGGIISLLGGSLLGSLFSTHPLSAYDETQLDVQNGALVAGKTTSQVESSAATKAAVSDYAGAVNTYLQNAHISIDLSNGAIVGGVGDMFAGTAKADVNTPAALFNQLAFKPDSTVDPTSNLFTAETGGLNGMRFADPTALQTELVKIATFTDNLDGAGIKLASVGTDLTNIVVASVDRGIPTGTADNPDPFTSSDLRTALANDLPGQTFANTDALDAEINKVSQFVGGTLPSLLNPVLDVSSSLQTSIQAMVHTYADAIAQATSYGLATDQLTAAQGKAIALLQAPALQTLALGNISVQQRYETATGQDTGDTQLSTFDIKAAQEQTALAASYTDIYGSLVPDAAEYGAALASLQKTQAAERVALEVTIGDQLVAAEQATAAARVAVVTAERNAADAGTAVTDAYTAIQGREATLAGDPETAALIAFDANAVKEQTTYARQLVDYYGDAFYQSADYESRMTQLTAVQQGERLAIVQQYGAKTSAAYLAAEASVTTLLTSLTTYAAGLQVGTDSPLSDTSQYTLAKSQFQAVGGAAAAGDYTSAGELQSYSTAFLAASKTVNGTGLQYAADFNSVLTALQAVASAPSDTLTASAQLAATQSQTDTLVGEFTKLRAAVNAVTAELQQQQRQA